MAYNPPPHYSFGDPADHQPQSVPPAYSPQPPSAPPPPPMGGYVPQQTAPAYQASPTGFAPPPVLHTGPRRSMAVPLLAVGMVVALAAAGVAMALWMSVKGDLEDATALADDREKELVQLQEDLDAAEQQAADLEVAAADSESMRACLDDLAWFYSTEEESDEEAEASAAVSESCDAWLW